MRVFFLIVLSLLIGGALGIFADRHPETRAWLDRLYEVPSIPAASPYAPLPDLSLLSEDARLIEGIYDPKALEDFGIRHCFYGLSDKVPLDRSWLQRDTTTRGLTDIPKPEIIPDLAEYPGLVKLEIIRSQLGSDREHCSAVRVDKHWFLSAAHCFESEDPDRALPIFDIIAETPSEDVRSAGTRVAPLRGALCHSEHGVSRYRYSTDIALFYVADVSAFSKVAIAPLEYNGMHLARSAFEKSYISGWGSNGGSRYLQGGPVSLSLLGESVLISERIGARGPNVGDSGAPLYINYGEGPLVVGILSQVTQDTYAQGETGIYVRVKSIKDWVERTKKICEVEGAYVC
jgi:hypothetical protein